VHVSVARTVHIFTTVSNANTHQTRPTLVTSLTDANKLSNHQSITTSYNPLINIAGNAASTAEGFAGFIV